MSTPSTVGSAPVVPVSDIDTPGDNKKLNNGWTKELEQLFAEWADRASCYRWMHDKTGRKYDSNDQKLMFPVIILSTLTGAANFAISSVSADPNTRSYIQLGLGSLSILTGIITTIANRLAYASSAEAHRGAAVSWGKFNRLICIELSLHPEERMEASAFMKMFRIELDRLVEQSPTIPQSVINSFIYEFKESTHVKRPDITGDIEHTFIYRDNTHRLKKLAEDATLTLMYKKGILKQLVLDDLDTKIRRIVNDAMLQSMPSKIIRTSLTSLATSARPEQNTVESPKKSDHLTIDMYRDPSLT